MNGLLIIQVTASSNYGRLTTNQSFRDVSAWYHIVVAFDSTQATASDRIKIYLNGSQITTFLQYRYLSFFKL
jgi:hypothetical protein